MASEYVLEMKDISKRKRTDKNVAEYRAGVTSSLLGAATPAAKPMATPVAAPNDGGAPDAPMAPLPVPDAAAARQEAID